MKTIKRLQIVASVLAISVALVLADNMNPTTNELLGSVTLIISGIASALSFAVNNDKKEAEQI